MDIDEAVSAVAGQAEVYGKAKAVADAERAELFKLVRAAAAAGARQVDLVKATGWTREYVSGVVSGKRGAPSTAHVN